MNLTGTICRLRWPYSNLEAAKTRPALILSEPDERGDIEVAMITGSDLHERSILIRAEDYIKNILPKKSFVRSDRILKIRLDVVEKLQVRLSLDFVKKVRKAILAQDTRAFSRLAHTANRPGDDPLRPENISLDPRPSTLAPLPVPYAGRVFTEDEVEAAVSATLDFWLTLGPEGAAFEKELAAFLGVKHSLLVNSGSSANLIALSCLTTHKLPEHKRLRPGDEVITCAAGFPTTVAPIVQNGCVPVFIDNDPVTGNARVEQLEAAYTPGRTKAVMMAHTLGNPFNLAAVLAFCKKYDLWLIEDNCDALGCTYTMPVEMARELGLDHLLRQAETNGGNASPQIAESEWRSADNQEPGTKSQERKLPFISNGFLTAYTGSFGDLSTQSFYPPHHLTMGEGGAVNIIRRASLKTYAESFRDWGRDCWCPSGRDNTCGKRFGWSLGELPQGYDHKYIYSHLGYNLKPLDLQAAIGRVQLRRLPHFIEARKRNWEILRRALADLEHHFDFSLPTHATAWNDGDRITVGGAASQQMTDGQRRMADNPEPGTKKQEHSSFTWDSTGCRTGCSWFGFMLRVKPEAPFTVRQLAAYLDQHQIGNRMLFGGNLVRQPVFVQLKKDNPNAFRIAAPPPAAGTQNQEEGRGPQETLPSALPGADAIMNTALFLGTFPGLSRAQLDYEIAVIHRFVEQFQENSPIPTPR